jgi:HAMP domain-containing protein
MPPQHGSSGKIVIHDLATTTFAGWDFRVRTSTGSKALRAKPLAAAAEAGNVPMLEAPWTDAFPTRPKPSRSGRRRPGRRGGWRDGVADVAVGGSTSTCSRAAGRTYCRGDEWHPEAVTWEAIILLLFLLGMGLEVLGAVITIKEIRRRLKAVDTLKSRGVTIRVSAHDAVGVSSGAATLSGGSEPTMQDRVARLEADLSRLRQDVKDAEERSREHTQRILRQGLEDLHHNVMQYVDRLREAFTRASGGGRSAYLGISLILLGFVLQSSANLIRLLTAGD